MKSIYTGVLRFAAATVLFFAASSTYSSATTVNTGKDTLAHILGEVSRSEFKQHYSRGIIIGLDNVIVTLYYRHDGRIDSLQTLSDGAGRFVFRNLDPQRVGLRIQKMGRKTISGVYDIEAGENAFYFSMEVQTEEISSAKVTAEIPLMKQIQDTTVYNTQAIRMMDDESLKTVLESLPGFEVSDKGVKVNGTDVKKTYVNGRLIFGDGVMTALNLLKAKEVTQVKVYDEQSAVDKHRGLKNSQKEKVLNVITKEKFLAAFNLNVGASGGADETGQIRYGAGIDASYNAEKLNISIAGGASNMAPGNATQLVGTLAFTHLPELLGDYSECENATVNFRKHWKDRMFGNSLSVSYGFMHNYDRSSTIALNEYFRSAENPEMTQYDTTMNSASRLMHNFNVRADLMDTPIKSVSLGLSGSFTGNGSDAFNGSLKKTEGMPDNSRHEFSGSSVKDYSISGDLSWTNNDPVKWRPSVRLNGSFSNNSHLSWTVDTLATSYLKRQLSSDGYGKSGLAKVVADVTGLLTNSDDRTISSTFSLTGEYNYGKSRQMSVDSWDVPSPVTDIANSYDYTRHNLDAYASAQLNYSDRAQRSLNLSVYAHNACLIDNEDFPLQGYHNFKNYFAPEFKLLYRHKDFNLMSSGSMRTPSIEQIRNRISDSNPLILTGGNPNLKYAYDISANALYSPFNKRNKDGYSQSLTLALSAYLSLRSIVNKSRYFYEDTVLDEWDGYIAKKGSMLNTYENSERPSWSTNFSANYRGSIKGNKFYFDASLALTYGRTPQYAGTEAIDVGDALLGANVSLNYRPSRKLHLSVGIFPSYIESRNGSGKELSGRFILPGDASCSWGPLRWLRFNCRYSCTAYRYVSGFGNDHTIHNLAAAIYFYPLKDNSLSISLSGNDLLNSGSTYRSSVTASQMSQTWTPIYGRFYMLSVIYKFTYKK